MKASTPTTKPNLWFTETALMAACTALATMDPGGEMSPEEADSFIAEFGRPDVAVARRQEFVDFLRVATAFSESKRQAAKELEAEAAALDRALDRARAGVLHVMRETGQKSLAAESGVLKLEEGRGSVEVVNELLIPPPFWRVKEDEDLRAIRRLARIVMDLSDGAVRAEADLLMNEAEERRKEVDKKAIQKAWSEQGSDVVECSGERASRLTVLAGEKQFEQEFSDTAPVVPGVRKRVDVKLTIK